MIILVVVSSLELHIVMNEKLEGEEEGSKNVKGFADGTQPEPDWVRPTITGFAGASIASSGLMILAFKLLRFLVK